MLVKDWMTEDVIVLDENASIMKASQIMKENNIRRIPVVRAGKLVGIVSDRDIKEATPSKATALDVHELYYLLSEVRVKDIMTPDPITVRPEDTVEYAAVLMLENRISGLPVVDEENRVVGIITQTDVFKLFVNITGIYYGPIQIGLEVEAPIALDEITRIVAEHGAQIISILTYREEIDSPRRQVFVRIKDLPEEKLRDLLRTLEERYRVRYWARDDVSRIRLRDISATRKAILEESLAEA
ncbi:CBS and ACT domain-containing protein [Thermosulfurimonas sp. F29]|uniref:CBS and ACT domain-containing protein n=1 Tax=Thermosulfurimonas sp. F29 TaxID=2867247 RepID=UPI001C836285|nr:CBS and ACT domain-containing protein [Thermosulfurimonas sp. F29]MBX6423691.1 CBS and ACT domain-containing protein [Thermosulfurimonas sp. F29]